MLKRFKFADGEVTLRDNGATVIGETAHKLYHASNELARKHKAEFPNVEDHVLAYNFLAVMAGEAVKRGGINGGNR